MKKIFCLAAFLMYFFALTSCNNNESKTEKTNDDTTSNSVLSPPSNCAPGDSSQIIYWEIDSATADLMFKNYTSPGKPSKVKDKRPHLEKIIKDSFPQGKAQWINARYRVEDVERYRTNRCLSATDSAGMVAQYSTQIIKVKVKRKNDKEKLFYDSYNYYDIGSIKPPPYEESGLLDKKL